MILALNFTFALNWSLLEIDLKSWCLLLILEHLVILRHFFQAVGEFRSMEIEI